MKEHEIAATINEVRDIAVEYHDTQQLRERLAHVLRPVLASNGTALAVATLQSVAAKLRRAGARLPCDNHGTIESAMHTGLSIALLQIEAEIEALGASKATPACTDEPEVHAAFGSMFKGGSNADQT